MTFKEAIASITEVLSRIGTTIKSEEYDGIIVKRLAASNTLDSDRGSTNQTHIAITGAQMDIFPYLCADGYFYEERRIAGVDLKKYFVIRIPVTLYESNLKHLGYDGQQNVFDDGMLQTKTSVVRSKRSEQADQLQVSMLEMDDEHFVMFRRLLHTGSYFVLLKRKTSMRYDAFGINPAMVLCDMSALVDMNNKFYKDSTSTIVETEIFNQLSDMEIISDLNQEDFSLETFDFDKILGHAINKIFFGVPGCGKSHYIEYKILGKDEKTKEYAGDYEKDNIIRTTFYQDYSNADFVGQILPKIVKGKNGESSVVEYIFNPGPFTLALIRAISNPTKKVALIIEELNRGNAAAIFGDMFQLLDRDEYGISEYGIKNVSLMDYLNDYEFDDDAGKKKKYKFSEIKIPGNMDIFATMNTSDQNVYTLDTAFTRRWEKEKIKNSFDKCAFASVEVPGMSGCTWQMFAERINGEVTKHLEDLQVSEDKQIGAFFVKESLLRTGTPEAFAYKVFDYLRSDVAKLDPQIIFKNYNTLDDLIKDYKKIGVGVFRPGIFAGGNSTPVQNEAADE